MEPQEGLGAVWKLFGQQSHHSLWLPPSEEPRWKFCKLKMEKNKEKQRKIERKLEYEEFNHQVNLRILSIKNKNQEEIANLEKKNHILSCLLSMASPQFSEATEKCFIQFSEEKKYGKKNQMKNQRMKKSNCQIKKKCKWQKLSRYSCQIA